LTVIHWWDYPLLPRQGREHDRRVAVALLDDLTAGVPLLR
jgi:hypothetical protein